MVMSFQRVTNKYPETLKGKVVMFYVRASEVGRSQIKENKNFMVILRSMKLVNGV
jgi:hypothetical protein